MQQHVNDTVPGRARPRFMHPLILALTALCIAMGTPVAARDGSGGDAVQSFPPLQPLHEPSERPMTDAPAYFVNPDAGDDANDGSKQQPWRTINHAVGELDPGDTLYLREGVYFENVYIAREGDPDAPITIRSYPGEVATIDGGFREFVESPENAWEPVPESEGGVDGEFWSVNRHPNIRDVLGNFGDSMVGLITYWHAKDLRSGQEFMVQHQGEPDVAPVYCGPGIWFNDDTGRIHVRLRHTHLDGIDNYKGETDPRELPLVIAPLRSVPLWLDGAKHVRIQDVNVRGGGYDTVKISQGKDVDLDYVTIHAGTYGVRTMGVRQFRFHRSSISGGGPPWHFRQDNSLRTGRLGDEAERRDIARLITHALLVDDVFREFEVFAWPASADWEISYSRFSHSHDGPYLGGIDGLRFHHNIVTDLHDDGLYLSPMSAHREAEIHIYQNYFGECLTALAFGGPHSTADTLYIYRNVFDMRGGVHSNRPTPDNPTFQPRNAARIMSDHGSPPWPRMRIYHNTAVTAGNGRNAAMGTMASRITPERDRYVLNNFFVYLEKIPGRVFERDENVLTAAGNVFAQLTDPGQVSGRLRQKLESIGRIVEDPAFAGMTTDPSEAADYALRSDSGAVNAGVSIPEDWADPLREHDRGQPDAGALPAGVEMWGVGPAGEPDVQ
ncbi:MAG: hypothetical protein ACOC9P_00420 [bacterium]